MIRKIITGLLLFNAAVSFAQEDVATASWRSSPVKVDGDPQEWQHPLAYYDFTTKLFFAFANDDKNLYLCFQTPDEVTRMKIIRAGMKVTLITKGGDKHKASINFPIEQRSTDSRPEKDDAGQANTEQKNNRDAFLVQHTVMELKGFTTRNGTLAINDSAGINAAINWDDTKRLTYEIAVPLTEIFGGHFDKADLLKSISLEVEVNAVNRQNNSGNINRSGGFGSGGRRGGGMGGGGGSHGGRGGQNNEQSPEEPGSSRTAMFEKTTLKQKFTLAQSH